ncbi:protein of unknown function [Clostridium cavendishii DSM 21758]|uniref:Card1 endonuclease domain-containing protein n=1 Tax=Clostridium cavendishii DSM 21758 TaxID=1121302 RepID=A0A1M6STW7_9CLOT|nr:DUF1887 family CARF protein [Clostridium cavendishii]SHK48070.1 protein of unknown function [Clostridium cavendishii DSM 21758]
MNYELIVSIFDFHNESSILLTEIYNPKAILFLYKKEDENLIYKLKDYYRNKFENVKFTFFQLDIFDANKLEKVFKDNLDKSILINLTSGKKLDVLLLLQFAIKNKIVSHYVDIENSLLYEFKDSLVSVEKRKFIDLNIDEVIESNGGSIIVDSTEITEANAVNWLTDMISKNLTLWHKLKSKLYDGRVFIHDINNPYFITVNSRLLTDEETAIYYKILNKLKYYGEIDYKIQDNEIKIYFNNNYIKGFIFKSGTWFEVFTKAIFEEIEYVDQVKNGVLFLWNEDKKKLRNELDVVAIKDSLLICISCKDSSKYDEVALNELNVYADELGGENVIKILAATKEPLKASVLERAKEMNIHLVVYNGNKNEFKNKLNDILNPSVR